MIGFFCWLRLLIVFVLIIEKTQFGFWIKNMNDFAREGKVKFIAALQACPLIACEINGRQAQNNVVA